MNLDEQLDFVIQKIAEQEQEVTDNMVRQLRAIQNRLRSNRGYMAESGRAILGNQYRPAHPTPPPQAQPYHGRRRVLTEKQAEDLRQCDPNGGRDALANDRRYA